MICLKLINRQGILIFTLFFVGILIVGYFAWPQIKNTLTYFENDSILSAEDISKMSQKCGDMSTDKTVFFQCWDNMIDDVINKYGIGSALDLAVKYYDMVVSPFECHDLMHKIGHATYYLYKSGKNFTVTNKINTCSFGFFHGFMELLTVETGNLAEIRKFCEYIDSETKKVGLGPSIASCYHGIGHGWATDHDNQVKDTEEFVNPALALCEKVVENQLERTYCATGVFDSLSLEYYNQRMPMNREDPLWLCRKQPEQYKEACYDDLMPAVNWLGDYDLAKSAPYIEKEKDDYYAQIAIKALAAHSIAFVIKQPDGFSKSVVKCRNIQKRLYDSCFRGLIDGVGEFRLPGSTPQDLKNRYCSELFLTSYEKESCLSIIDSFN